MDVIEARGLSKAFGRKRAIDQFDMCVRQGDVYGFVGRNGAGKTTVMRMVAGLAAPSEGSVSVFGSSPKRLDPPRRVGVLIEAPGLYGSMNAYNNMMLKALALGLVQPKERVKELLSLTGLMAAGSKKTKHFSMGMKQRLGLALALLGDPDLLLLDEPLNGLDPEGAIEIRQLIVRLNQERGITIVVSSHVLEQLGKMVTRYGIIREGRMVRELGVDEVERECSDFLQLEAADPQRSLALLQERFPDLCIQAMPDGSLRLFGDVDAGQVGEVLNAADIALQGLYRHKRDLEDFFVALMGDDYRA